MRVVLAILISAVLAAASPSVKWPPKDLTPEENLGSVGLNFTLMSRDEYLEKRQPGGVYICTDINWGGTCGYAKQPWNLCIQLDSPWYHTISSIGPDEYNAIVAYSDYSCGSSAQLAIFNPGYPDLRPAGWNDRIGSFRVLQIPGKNCLGASDLDSSYFRTSTNCNSCCNGCNRSGQDCCPDGLFC
ncbi:hypothetical protein QBC33DRAFT_619089 [Phialemonium atrogriseum]|uniref:Uncharacterized protein n=1 Tax=Phialemonium atrogriseum TaxID=1093897 RepID=A0AAJ0C166_9PEZI|nr:uncharacterized protein QBC33DRAFT_619089 [Phialemonium atrogriseum]KAK1768234.1 hypothetical protein QBC33DRAFT_619089 [Phialemonium atrogriseum]